MKYIVFFFILSQISYGNMIDCFAMFKMIAEQQVTPKDIAQLYLNLVEVNTSGENKLELLKAILKSKNIYEPPSKYTTTSTLSDSFMQLKEVLKESKLNTDEVRQAILEIINETLEAKGKTEEKQKIIYKTLRVSGFSEEVQEKRKIALARLLELSNQAVDNYTLRRAFEMGDFINLPEYANSELLKLLGSEVTFWSKNSMALKDYLERISRLESGSKFSKEIFKKRKNAKFISPLPGIHSKLNSTQISALISAYRLKDPNSKFDLNSSTKILENKLIELEEVAISNKDEAVALGITQDIIILRRELREREPY